MFTQNPAAEPISFKILENYSLQAKYVVNQLKICLSLAQRLFYIEIIRQPFHLWTR